MWNDRANIFARTLLNNSCTPRSYSYVRTDADLQGINEKDLNQALKSNYFQIINGVVYHVFDLMAITVGERNNQDVNKRDLGMHESQLSDAMTLSSKGSTE